MMTFARAIWADLVEKRLWPLAVVLVLALVAVPVALPKLTGGDTATDQPLPAKLPAVAGAADPGKAALTVLADTPQGAPKGRYHDPFKGGPRTHAKAQPSGPSPAASGTSAAKPAASAAKAPRPAPAPKPAAVSPVPHVSSPPPVHHTVHASPAPVARPAGMPAGVRVDVSWGRAGSTTRLRDLIRLGRLKGADAPVALLFGVRGDHKTAVFLLLRDVTAVGNGTCLPRPRDCQLLELKAGESEFFDVEGNRGVTQYELDVDKVLRRTAPTLTEARSLRHRESKLGRQLMFAAVAAGRDASTDFMYKSHLGVLVRELPGR